MLMIAEMHKNCSRAVNHIHFHARQTKDIINLLFNKGLLTNIKQEEKSTYLFLKKEKTHTYTAFSKFFFCNLMP